MSNETFKGEHALTSSVFFIDAKACRSLRTNLRSASDIVGHPPSCACLDLLRARILERSW